MIFDKLRSLTLWDCAMVVLAIFFVIVKIPYLDLPYFWDEAWVYAPAVFDLYEHGPSLSPDAIDPYLSRGHPILFHFLAVCWMNLFGSGFVAVHSFALFLSVCLLFAVYALGNQLLDRSAGFWAAGFLAIQPIFLQQSGFLLPEIQLSLFTVLTILFYLRRSIPWFIISGTCLLLTKETGILTIGIIGLMELFQFIADRELSKKRVLILLSVGAPVALAFLYFLVQYFQFGWFTFPEHMGMFETDLQVWKDKVSWAIQVIFYKQQRQLLMTVLFASIGLGWVRGPWLARVAAIIIALAFYTITGLDSWLPDWYFHWVVPIALMVFSLSMIKPLHREGTVNHLFFPLSMLLMLVMILFTSWHYFIDRYFMFLFALLMLCISVGIHLALKRAGLFKYFLLVIVGFMAYHFMNRIDSKKRWNNLKYTECITVTQRSVEYLLEHADRVDGCITSSYALSELLKAPGAGYVTEDNRFPCAGTGFSDGTTYILESSFEALADIDPRNLPDFEEVWHTQDGDEWVTIYKRISK